MYPGVCPGDPTCEQFGFTHRDQFGRLYPTPMMEKSLLFNLIKLGIDPKAKVDPKYFKQVCHQKSLITLDFAIFTPIGL